MQQKYTAADVREKRISFKGLTQEQFLALQAHFHKLYPEDGYAVYNWCSLDKYHRFYVDLNNPGDVCAGMYSERYAETVAKQIKSTLEITYDEFEFGQQEADGWIPWNGGECPVPAGTLVDVKYRNDEVSLEVRVAEFGAAHNWDNDGVARDIVAYRICPVVEQPFDFNKEFAESQAKMTEEAYERFWNGVDKVVIEKLTTKSILLEAEELINGERAKDYGKVSDNFANIAVGWNVIAKGGIDARKVGHMMAWVKICRDLQNPKHDNLVDAAGYMGCIDKMSREQ